MASVHDVAAYILHKTGSMSAMRLEKLVYYCQAWSTVWDERPLFPERIEAWANGPVVPALYELHRGVFSLDHWAGDPSKLDAKAIETIDAVLDGYGDLNAQELSDLTHAELPWRAAREGLDPMERGNHEVSLATMCEYYSTLQPADG